MYNGAGGHAIGDVLIEIENLIGSDHNDILVGDIAGNILDGGKGDDTLTGGDGVDKFVLGGVEDGTDIVTDFTNFDRILVPIDTPLIEQPDNLNELLTSLGLTLEDGTDRTGNGAHDTAILQGDTVLMILENIDAVEIHQSYFEIEVV